MDMNRMEMARMRMEERGNEAEARLRGQREREEMLRLRATFMLDCLRECFAGLGAKRNARGYRPAHNAM